MSTERTGITGDAGSPGIDTDNGFIAREGWGGLTACIALVFALSGCAALPITFDIAQVGNGFSNGDPSVVPDTECLYPVIVGCEAEHGSGFVGGALDRPDRPNVPDVPDEPDNDQCDDGDNDRDDKPGWGRGDKNHDHSGPPGQE